MDVLNVTPDTWLQCEVERLEHIKNDINWNSVPLVNVNDLQDVRDNQLVRFRGMVQHMYDPEYYFEKYEVVNETTKDRKLQNGKYRDSALCMDGEVIDFDSQQNVTSERHTLVVISVPGLNSWAENIEMEQHKFKTCNNAASSASPSSSKQVKRTLESESMETDVQPSVRNDNENKRQCTENKTNAATNQIVSREHILNFPLPDRAGKACHIKIYNNFGTMKLNDLIEFVGFLSVDPVLTHKSYHNNEYDNEMEIQTHNPPPSLVPRIHCVSWRNVEHNNPLMHLGNNMNAEKMDYIYKELQIVLTQLLLGDQLAAEYFILHLISSVYHRSNLMALGKFTLNISKIPTQVLPDYGKHLYDFIELLVPKSHYLPMTLENMNELAFTPKKDYECNRLTSGVLQLSKNTHLVLDETKLTPGQLNASGVQGIGSLANVIKNQKLMYDFNYYQMEFDCDIPFLIFSEGKSLLPSDFHVPMKYDVVCLETFKEIVEAAHHFLKPELLKDVRVYLTKARHTTYELSESVQELVQNEFVKMRQDTKATADDLHQLLVLARLVCLSQGKTTLDETCWKMACSLEAKRKERFSVPR